MLKGAACGPFFVNSGIFIIMGRLKKLKLENIRKANELLEKNHAIEQGNREIQLKPSENVTNNPKDFVKRMNNLTEDHKKHYKLIKETEEDTYWVISKAQRDILLKNDDNTIREVGKGAVSYDGFNPSK